MHRHRACVYSTSITGEVERLDTRRIGIMPSAYEARTGVIIKRGEEIVALPGCKIIAILERK